MLRQWVNCATTPERIRAMTIPRRLPETTMLRARGRRFGGASSPTRGSMIWGVTVVMAVMKETPRKTEKFEVRQRTILVIESA